jgi:hypothetical protein
MVRCHAGATTPYTQKIYTIPAKIWWLHMKVHTQKAIFVRSRRFQPSDHKKHTHILKRGCVAMLMLQNPYTQKIYTIPAKIWWLHVKEHTEISYCCTFEEVSTVRSQETHTHWEQWVGCQDKCSHHVAWRKLWTIQTSPRCLHMKVDNKKCYPTEPQQVSSQGSWGTHTHTHRRQCVWASWCYKPHTRKKSTLSLQNSDDCIWKCTQE